MDTCLMDRNYQDQAVLMGSIGITQLTVDDKGTTPEDAESLISRKISRSDEISIFVNVNTGIDLMFAAKNAPTESAESKLLNTQ